MPIVHGFELLHEQVIRELNTTARIYRHVKSGAELLSLINDDENKVFGITFRTPPTDSTGVAHILEHSVLCGSRKYPVKEPFVELLKGSLKTFLNAMTYPDKTTYPVASQNVQDFYNLIDVYLDAVFYPRLTPEVLQQEGWHLDLDSPDRPMIYKGVVYNEMKGAYSSPERVLAEYSQQSLFPDNTYGLDSGGHPNRIPELTFDQFLAFHRKYYHPSNARITFCGDDNPEERLRIANAYLQDFERVEIDSGIPLQPSFREPKRTVLGFAAGGSDDSAPKGMISMNWLLADTTDAEFNLAFTILEYILLGMPASPLRKALIESGLGEDLAGVGLEGELRQMYFSTGMKGIDVANAERIEKLILGTLTALAENGIDPYTIEAALNTIEFRLRENHSGGYPRGLLLMLRSLTTWLYDGDPVALLAFEGPLAAVKDRLAANPAYFQELIRRYLLYNPHRTTLILEPDRSLGERQEADERQRLERIRQDMDAKQLQDVIDLTRELKKLQEAADPPEALATIPTLKVEDLEKTNKYIPLDQHVQDGAAILLHDLFTNGIAYLDLGFDLHQLEQSFLPYVPLFGRALVEMGTQTEDYVAFTQRISRKTGGIRPKVFSSLVKDSSGSSVYLFLRGKAMLSQTGEFLGILQDVLHGLRLDDRERFRQMVLEEKARNEQAVINLGHQMVGMRLRAHFNEADWAAEQMGGVSYLFFLRNLARAVEEDWPRVLATLQQVRDTLVNRKAMVANVTVDAAGWAQLGPEIQGLLSSLPQAPAIRSAWAPQPLPGNEALVAPTQVNFVGKGANLYDLGYLFHGSALVITRYLRTSWLWDRVRVQGGAYGAFCQFSHLSGVLTLISYRDPNLLETLDVFDACSSFLADTELSSDELSKAIIGTIGDLDSYMLPDAKGFASMARVLSGNTEEARQRLRDEVLSTTVADFRAFADVLAAVKDHGLVAMLGSESSLARVHHARPGWLQATPVL
jgi:Zn-dependent M16 (insulinase) family peptidase